MNELATSRARLAELEAKLMWLRHQHDIAMSRFLFEEATTLGPALAALERERDTLAATLPPPVAPCPTKTQADSRGRDPGL